MHLGSEAIYITCTIDFSIYLTKRQVFLWAPSVLALLVVIILPSALSVNVLLMFDAVAGDVCSLWILVVFASAPDDGCDSRALKSTWPRSPPPGG